MKSSKTNVSLASLPQMIPDSAYRAIHGIIGQAVLDELWDAPWDTPFTKVIPELGIALGTHPGLRRSRNEDRAVVARISIKNQWDFTAAVVCDGVGGSEMGDIAATLAIAAMLDELTCARAGISLESLLVNAIRNADDVVRTELRGEGTTTATVVLVSAAGNVAAANIGDSRIFSWNGDTDRLRQVSIDDTMENELKDLPVGDRSVLDERGLRGRLSQALGESNRAAVDLRIVMFGSQDFGRGAILASDGAWRGSEDGFISIAKHTESAPDAARRLLAFARWAGGPDNISIVAIEDISQLVSGMKRSRQSQSSTQAVVWICESKFVVSTTTAPAVKESVRTQSSGARPKLTHTKRKKKKWAVFKNPDKDQGQLLSADTTQPREKRPKVEISVDDDPPPPQ